MEAKTGKALVWVSVFIRGKPKSKAEAKIIEKKKTGITAKLWGIISHPTPFPCKQNKIIERAEWLPTSIPRENPTGTVKET